MIATFPLPSDLANLAPVEIPPDPPPAITTSYSLNDLENTLTNPQDKECLLRTCFSRFDETAK